MKAQPNWQLGLFRIGFVYYILTLVLAFIGFNGNFQVNISMSHFDYILFHKPFGVLSNFTDTAGRETLQAYIPIKDVYAAGRLDYDSEGLLLLTNDGALIRRITEPRFHLPKTYWVQVEGLIGLAELTQLQRGVEIHDYHTQPCKARLLAEPQLPPRRKPITPHAPPSWLEITLQEGKKRQVRQMTAAVGFPTLRLVRVAIGPLHLEGLAPGEWRRLTPAEEKALRTAGR